MTRGIRNAVSLTAVAAGALLMAACGSSDSCATETPQLSQAPRCPPMAPNVPVQVSVQICPTCNQTDAECHVDLSAVSSNIIHFDTLVHACDPSNSCPPSCSTSGVTCSFTTPGEGTYNLFIGDDPHAVTFTVGGSATTCG